MRTAIEILVFGGALWWALALLRKRDRALHDSEAECHRRAEQFDTFLDTAAVAIHRMSADGRILWANDTELAMLGYERDEYVGRHISQFHKDPESIADILRRLHHGERVQNYEARMKCKDGSIKTVLIASSMLFDRGAEAYAQCFTRDITERKRDEESHAHLAAIVQASEDAVVSKTLDGVITSWNRAAVRMFGYSEKEAVGSRIDIIIPPDRLAEEQDILARLRRGEGIDHYETVRRTKSGRTFDISITVSPVRDRSGRVIGASKIARDITDRKRLETEREETDRRKDEFIAILAHELRNPLVPIRNAAHYMKSFKHQDLTRPLDMIERQTAQMTRLIDDLLDVSRISRGVLELRKEHVRCSEIVEAAIDATRDEMREKGHTLHTQLPDEPIELDADRARLLQVICNLLGNASKYTPIGGQIELDVDLRHDKLEISVRDNGIGIPPERLSDIFELFTRVDQSLGRQGGLGIGLTLAQQIVELHGGTIEALSLGTGLGSEFIVRLPIVATEPQVVAATVASAVSGSPRRVLVADDNRDVAESLALLLEYAGHDVHLALDGEAALVSAEALHPDVALVDIGMPKANGYQVARRIRQQPWGKEMYLVALTGWGQEADKRRAREAGFDLHLVKPVSPEALQQLLVELPITHVTR